MLKFWKRRRLPGLAGSREPSGIAPAATRPVLSPEAAAEKHRLADTNGTLRRMRQTVENNRLL